MTVHDTITRSLYTLLTYQGLPNNVFWRLLFQEGVQAANNGQAEMLEVEGEVQPEPLDMRFPSKGFSKQITYIVLFPIIFPLWLTLPDTRGERGK